MSRNDIIVRVDKFVVPKAARDEFVARIRETHELLRNQPGFIRDLILEQVAGPGRFNVVTVVEWQDQESIDAARAVVKEAHAARGFSPQELMQRLGVEADIADYQQIDG